jgi:hypothetical protein
LSDPRHAFIDRWFRRNYRFNDEDVLSVTTILKNVHSWHLEQWKIKRAVDVTLGMATRSMREVHRMAEPDDKGQRHASGAVVQIMDALNKPALAATKGVRVHEAFESWFTTGSLPKDLPDDEVPYIEQALRFAEEWNVRPIHLEPEVYAQTGYAGSVDWIFQIGEDVVLGDTKTGGVYESAAMQLAAYAHADRLYPRTDEEPCAVLSGGECACRWEAMPPVDRLAVLDLKADSYLLRWVTPMAAGLAWRAFQGAQAIHAVKRHKELFVNARQNNAADLERESVVTGGGTNKEVAA